MSDEKSEPTPAPAADEISEKDLNQVSGGTIPAIDPGFHLKPGSILPREGSAIDAIEKETGIYQG